MSKSSYVVAVVGVTGVVGQEMLRVLEQRKFPVERLVPLASERSSGSTVRFQGKEWKVDVAGPDAFEGVDIALFSAGNPISIDLAPHAVKAGAVVIDNSSAFRMEESVPLIVPEVNGDALKTHKGIIANPNCSTAQLVMALKPLHDAAGLKRVVVSTYQSVSGWGKEAMEELKIQIEAYLRNEKITAHVLQKQIAFNLIPHIDKFMENGYTKEEMKMILETRKILGIPHLAITATAVRVPVMISHSESVNVQTEKKLTAAQARGLMASFPNIKVVDDPAKNGYPTPLEAAGKDETFVGRIREDVSAPNALDFWVVSDNLRKGAALNAVQIAEELVARKLLRRETAGRAS